MSRLGPLRHRDYRLLWLGRGGSSVGDSLVIVATAFAVISIGGSASQLGTLLAVNVSARLVFQLAGGVWADRLPRQLVMLASDCVRGATQLAVGVLLVTHHARFWELCVGTAAHGTAAAFFGPASDGLVPQLVPKDELTQAVATLDVTRSVPQVVGPAISGVLVAVFGPGWVFLIDATSYAFSAACLQAMRLPPLPNRVIEPFFRELRAGWQAVIARAWCWQNLIVHAIMNLAITAFFVLGPLVSNDHYGGAKAWGLISGALSLGGICGSLLAMRLHPSRPLVVANLAFVFGAAPAALLAFPAPWWTVAIGAFASAAGLGVLNALWSGVVGREFEPHVLSRVSSYDWLISLVMAPLGYLIVGPLAASIGRGPTLTIAALLLGVPAVLVAFLPSVRSVRGTGAEAPALTPA